MYGQGNYAPQLGQSPHRPLRPPFLQQVNLPPASAGLFHHGPPVPSPAAIQPAAQQPHLGSPSVSAYQFAPAMPPPLARPYMPNPFSSTGQTYLPPPPTGRGSNDMMHPYSSAQQGAQQHPQSGVQSAQYISPSPPLLGHSGVLPPPPPQIQNLYRPPPASAWPPPPPMPIQSCNLPSPSTFHSVASSTGGETNTGSAVSQLPPLPPSSPPLPPPPPPSSATPSSKPMGLDLPTQPLCDPSSDLASFSVSVRDELTESQNRENIQLNHSSDRELETERVDACSLEGDLSSKQSIELDLPPPPPRPTSEKTLRNIEILCQFISKNGPDFEDMVRQKEAGNPEFIFLFGGEVGSEAAIAQEYYLWMKDKSCLEYGLLKGEKQTNLFLTKKHAENPPSVEQSIREAASCALSDSDMDMEDDTNRPGEELPVRDHVSGLQQDSIPAEGGIQEPKKYNLLQTPGGGISTVKLGPPIQLGGDVGGKKDRTSGSVIVTDSPIKLLKEYASDDDSEDDAGVCATVDEQAATLQLQKAVPVVSGECMMRDSDESKAAKVGPAGSLEGCEQPTDLNSTLSSETIVYKMISAPSSLEKKSGQDVDDTFRTDSPRQNTSFDDLEGKGALKYSSGIVVCNSANAQGECKKNAAAVKVDEFGRLFREGASETDSDGSSYNRRDRRRGRSRSASRSPPVKRRRSPRGRNERRSRSRSWSPRRRRSWSRSPRRRRSRSRSPFRRTIDASNKSRRGGYQIGLCFNYLKGKCYRGDSCRYRHSDPDKHGGSRHYKSKHHPSEIAKSSRDYDFLEEDETKIVKGSLVHDVNGEEMKLDEVNKQEVKAGREEHTCGVFAIVDEKDRGESVAGSLQYDLLARDSSEAVTDSNRNATIEESTACLHRESDPKNVSENVDESKRHVSPMKDDHFEHIQSESLTQDHHALANQPQSNTGPSPSIAHAPSASSPQLSEVMPCQSVKPDEPVGQQDVLASDSSAINCSYQVSQLPPSLPLLSLPLPMLVPVPPPPPSSHVANIPHVLQPVQGYISAPAETNLPLQTAPMGNHPSYSVLLPNQRSQYPAQRNPSWSTLPAPQLCPPYVGNPPIHGGLAPFQQESLPLRSDPPVHSSLKINPTDLPSHLEAGGLHERAYPSMPDAQQSTPRVDHYLNSAPGLIPSSSSHGIVPLQPGSSFGGTNSNKVQSFSHGILPPNESSGSHLHNPPYLHQRPSYEFYQAAGETIGGPSCISDAGHRRASHYNPYASTFDQPLSSKFNPVMFRQEETHFGRKYENSFSFGHPSFDAQKASYGASNLIPSPNSSRAGGQTLLKSGGDQYDPLFDSIDPSAGSLKNKQLGPEGHAADNSDIMLRLSACKQTDVKVNKEKKELEAVAAATSFENDEFGETADVEAGVVESGSESNPIDGAKVATSDDEIDQVETEGKSKKNKESRSMKLFRVELANFVKGMLKPSWRQGNMSKEAFKTIVKKTVEKVSGAMEGHRVPKSKAKIGQYIDRSKDKLARLVQGYVNKYAKA